MNPVELRALLADPRQAGAFFIDAGDSDAMAEAAHALDYAVLRIDLADGRDKPSVLALLGEALRFPDWVGGNWDALADAVTDLSWFRANGYLLLLEHASAWRAHAHGEVDVLVDILDEAAASWARQGTAFWTLLPLPGEEWAGLAP